MSRYEFTAGEEMTAAKLNKSIIGGSYNAGETINGATLPVPVYQNTTDNKFYACDADDTDKLNFVGFAISDSTDGNPIDIQFNGIVKGFSGLDEGEKYYVQDTVGTIGKTKGTYYILVGIAISETELLIMKEIPDNTILLIPSDNLKESADTEEYVETSSIFVKLKSIRIYESGTIRVKFDGKATGSAQGKAQIYKNGETFGTLRDLAVGDYVTFSEDLTFEAGDTIELWVAASGSGGDRAYVKNFRLYFDKVFGKSTSVVDA